MKEKILGSSWSIWDLHVHTPESIIEHYGKHNTDVWEKYIEDLNNLPDNVTVLGINDYLFLDGYEKVKKYFDEGKLPKIKKLFPVIELRLKIFGNQSKNDAWHRINFHVIFSDEIDVETIKSQFISGLSSHYNLLPEDQSFWNGVLTPKSLADFGKLIKENSTVKIDESDLEVGFNSLNFSEEGVFKLLENNHYFKNKHLTAIGKTEWEKLRWDGSIAEKLHIINSVDFIFTASESVGAFNKSEMTLSSQLKAFNLLDCSDSHYFSNSKEKDRIGNCNLWIKAEPTFEGLKQLKYEPNYRKIVAEIEPRKPYRTIESIRFDFPTDTVLRNSQTGTIQPFCLTELKDEIYFSPYFTCIIGGRGAGKSTIINIIAEKLGEKTDFFANNKILINKKTDVLRDNENSCINITGTSEIEFISQGRVEELSDGNHLTDLIFNERIKAVGNEYLEKEKQLLSRFELINESIKLSVEIEDLKEKLKIKKSSLDNDKKIIASIENEIYKELSTKINNTSKEIEEIQNNKESYKELLNQIVELIFEFELENPSNDYGLRINEIVTKIRNLDEITKLETENNEKVYRTTLKVFSTTDEKLEKKRGDLISFKQEVIEYFTSIGSTPDSIADVDRATSNIAIVSSEIESVNKDLISKKEKLDNLISQTSDIKSLMNDCEIIIQSRLEKINKDLDIENENVEKIRFEQQFNSTKFLEILHSEFYNSFKSYHKSNLSWENIYSCIDNIVEPNENSLNINHDEYLEKIRQHISSENTLYGKTYLEIFEKESNFKIFQLLILKTLYNISQNVMIVGYYGNSPLSSCSFGQRCTAVVVTLLMTGVKPLLIDEPEAHLDNRLIAEYLVDLIKEKKNERQIIFATHNANFVINGDAELIHILEIPKDEVYTKITSTTIENLNNRKSLLKLEGGEEAFRKRDKKLLSSKFN